LKLNNPTGVGLATPRAAPPPALFWRSLYSPRGDIGMDSFADPSQAARSLDAVVPSQIVQRLFSGTDAPGRRIETAVRPYRLQLLPNQDGVRVLGDEVAVTIAAKILEAIGEAVEKTGRIDEALIRETVAATIQNALKYDLAFRLAGISHTVRPLSLSQAAFMNMLLFADRALVFGVGPTGTGKTHLAIAAGLSLVTEGRFKTLVVTRPRVLLEGEVMTAALRAETTYDEQLTPIDDVLCDLVGHEGLKRLTERGQITIMPLGQLRGRTFNESFVVIDEAQNMTVSKMRMAVTRLGRASRMVVTGDPAQTDLPGAEPSGLTHLLQLIAGTDLARIHKFENREIIRNDLVARLEALYSGEGGREAGRPAAPTSFGASRPRPV
jgi:phosphate starvation-inducible PhoH-like protein